MTRRNNIEDISYGIYYRNFGTEVGNLRDQDLTHNCFDAHWTYVLRSAGMVNSCDYFSNTNVSCEVVQAIGMGWNVSSNNYGSVSICAPSQFTSGVGPDRAFNEGHTQILEIVKSRDSEKLYDFAKSTRNEALQQLSYGALIHLRDFKAARRLLGLMEAPSRDFKRIQEIVLDFRSNEKEFRLDRESENFLSELARGDEGQIDDVLYARSILYLTKGVHFGDIYDAPHDREIEGRSASVDNTSKVLTSTSIAPNPVQDSRFELFVGTDLDVAPSTFIIANSVGEVISRSAITAEQMVVDLPQGIPGVYSISLLSDEGEILKSLRFVRLK